MMNVSRLRETHERKGRKDPSNLYSAYSIPPPKFQSCINIRWWLFSFILFFHLAGSQPATIAKLLLKNLTYNINAKPLILICVGGLSPKEYLSE